MYDSPQGYGYGFVRGILTALEKQSEENQTEWGLVLVIPKEVEDAAQNLVKKTFKAKTENNIDPSTYAEGYEEGKKFEPLARTEKKKIEQTD